VYNHAQSAGIRGMSTTSVAVVTTGPELDAVQVATEIAAQDHVILLAVVGTLLVVEWAKYTA
jgi:hypothetical protein